MLVNMPDEWGAYKADLQPRAVFAKARKCPVLWSSVLAHIWQRAVELCLYFRETQRARLSHAKNSFRLLYFCDKNRSWLLSLALRKGQFTILKKQKTGLWVLVTYKSEMYGMILQAKKCKKRVAQNIQCVKHGPLSPKFIVICWFQDTTVESLLSRGRCCWNGIILSDTLQHYCGEIHAQ